MTETNTRFFFAAAAETWEPVDALALARDHARLAMPVQLIWGANDPTFPLAVARAALDFLG